MSVFDLVNELRSVAGGNTQPQLSSGLNAAFQSNETPPFGQMIGQLFANSDGQQRAGILNHLIAAAGPAAAGGLLGQITGSGGQVSQVTPQQAQQVQPEAAQQLAEHAQAADPSIMARAADFYSQHPQVVQSLGAGALALIMSHVRGQAGRA